MWISSPVSVTIDASTSIPYWAPLGESLERRVEELDERTIVDVQATGECGFGVQFRRTLYADATKKSDGSRETPELAR